MASESETMPPADTPGTDEPSTEKPSIKEPSTKPTEERPSGPLVDPLEAPLPPEFTAKELITKRREEKGPIFACCFATCCCFLCYEKMEFVLDFLCCRTCK